MHGRAALSLTLLLLASSCIVLGIDFDKKGITSGSGSSSGAGSGGGGGSGGAGGDSGQAPTCGGVDLLTDLGTDNVLYRLNVGSSAAICAGAWTGGSTVNIAIPAGADQTNYCQVQTAWNFDARGRRFAAHIATPVSQLGTAPAGIQIVDPNALQITIVLHGDGTLSAVAADVQGGTTTPIAGPIDVGGDTYLAAHFDAKGTLMTIETASQSDAWTARVANVDLSMIFPNTAFDTGSVRTGIVEVGTKSNPQGGSVQFDRLYGETDVPTGEPPSACPISSLQETFNAAAGLPNKLVAGSPCVLIANHQLSLCSPATATGSTTCTVHSRHLYRLAGSRLDVQVTGLDDAADEVLLGAFPPAPAMQPASSQAQMRFDGNGDLRVGNPIKLKSSGLGVPTFLDIEASSTGDIVYGIHTKAGRDPVKLRSVPEAVVANALSELRVEAILPPGKCVTVDNLNLP